MARQRRGGFRPPELRGTLGTLLRTTLAQAGGLRDALERGAREGRARIDDALAGRRRNDALIELGELVLDLIRRGEIEIDQLPEARELVAHLDELDHADDDAADFAPAPSRSRFDDRGNDGTVSAGRSWVPPKKSAAPARIWRPVEESDRPVEHVPPPAPPKKLGGISFGNDNDDEDLADYMHPDDVPPRDK